jgi:hypothetical protein
MLTALRGFFLDASAPPPPDLTVYCWPYPSERHVIVRGFVRGSLGSGLAPVLGDLLKFYPLGFWVVWQKPDHLKLDLPDLTEGWPDDTDGEIRLSLSLRSVPGVNWPEAPSGMEALLLDFGRSHVATARRHQQPSK